MLRTPIVSAIGASVLVVALAAHTGTPAIAFSRAITRTVGHDTQTANASLEQQIVAKEREGLDALKAGDLKRFGDLTADDAVLIDDHGPAAKAQVLKNVAGFRLTDYTMDGEQFVPLSAQSGLITYKISEKGNSNGKDFAAQAYVSSIWTHRGSTWVCLFSQETTVK
jgi:ketosteroid isomerase-like protein